MASDGGRVYVFSILYIVLSATLIHFNKQLVNDTHFPHPMALSVLHMASTSAASIVLYLVAPQLFTSMSTIKGLEPNLMKIFLPQGFFFAVSLYCANTAYFYCSAAFLQFTKESSLIFVYLMSCMTGMSQFSCDRLVIIMWILLGVSLAVAGEVEFVLSGFIFQIGSQLAECSKNVLGEWLMLGKYKLDPLTYILFMAPICCCFLLAGNIVLWNTFILLDVMRWWHLLLPNSCVAILLNFSIAALIKESNAMALILSGLVKDMLIVLVSAKFFHEKVAFCQYVGLAVCLSGVFFWSYCRAHPDSKAVLAFQHLCWCPPKEETKPLVPEVTEEGYDG